MKVNNNIIYDALKAQFRAKEQKALATLTIYLTNPVGIGEHPQHLEEMLKLAEELTEARDVVKTLENTFEAPETPTTNE